VTLSKKKPAILFDCPQKIEKVEIVTSAARQRNHFQYLRIDNDIKYA